MAKGNLILDVLIFTRAAELADAVNGLHEDEPDGIARENIQSIEHDGNHGRWVVFYWRPATAEDKNKKPLK